MTEAEALALLTSLLTLPDGRLLSTTDPSSNKAAVMAMSAAAGFDVSTLVVGDPTERWIEVMGRGLGYYANVSTSALYGLFFALATDPGDVRDDGTPDASVDQTPRPGMLSALGAGLCGTERNGATPSTSRVTIRNDGTAPSLPVLPGRLTLDASTLVRADGGVPTFITIPDATVYTGIGGTLPPLAPGASVTLPVQSTGSGSYFTAPVNTIDTVVTQSFGTFTVTASTSAQARDREARPAYIARCLLAGDKLAKGGTVKACQYAATTQVDPTTGKGTALLNYLSGDPVSITGALVIPDSSANTITVFFYGAAGPVGSPSDIASANANIRGPLLDDGNGTNFNPATLAVVPETVTYSGSDSTATAIAVTWSARISGSAIPGGAAAGTYTSGGSPPASVAAIFAQAATGLSTWLPSLGPGGQDAVAGVGVVWTEDIEAQVKSSVTGLRNVNVATPAGPSTAIVLGHIPTAGTITGTLVVT